MSSLRPGDGIVVKRPIVTPYFNAHIEPGERGRVVDVDPDTGDVVAALNTLHPELAAHRNLICIPADSSDVARVISVRRYLTMAIIAGIVLISVASIHLGSFRSSNSREDFFATATAADSCIHPLAGLPTTLPTDRQP